MQFSQVVLTVPGVQSDSPAAGALRQALGALKGAAKVTVAAGSVLLAYDPDILSLSDVKRTAASIGLPVTALAVADDENLAYLSGG